jgi:hypothetical protein
MAESGEWDEYGHLGIPSFSSEGSRSLHIPQSRNVELSLCLGFRYSYVISSAVSGLYARTHLRYVTCNPSPVLLASNEVTVFTIDYRMYTARSKLCFVNFCRKRGNRHVVILLSGPKISPTLRPGAHIGHKLQINRSATEFSGAANLQ